MVKLLALAPDRRVHRERLAEVLWPDRDADAALNPGLLSWLLRVDCAPDGGMEIDPDFFVDLHDRPGGPARAHEVRLQGGDCTTEIFP